MSAAAAPATSKLADVLDMATSVAYIAVVGVTFYILFPGLRQSARELVNHAVFSYRYGVFLAQRSPVAKWVRDAALGRVVEGDGIKPKAE